MSDEFKATLWELAESWPCDYAHVERQPRVRSADGKYFESGKDVKTPLAISVHLDGCRKCQMKKHLIRLDELLKRTAEADFQQFLQAAGDGGGWVSEAEFNAISEHAQTVRGEMLGVPR